jgi:hypothetical protein
MLKLFCYVRGDVSHESSTVDINDDAIVADLKKVIKKEMTFLLAGFAYGGIPKRRR